MANLPDIRVTLEILPSNINHMPPAKFLASLDLDQICLFLDEHYFGQTDLKNSNLPSSLILTTTAHFLGSPSGVKVMAPVIPG
jgi:hypothetical protein